MTSHSYVTHAFCSNCYHKKEPIFWHQKPVIRCPKCNNRLRQNTQKSRFKTRNRLVIRKTQSEAAARRRWREKNREKIKQYNQMYYIKNRSVISQKKQAKSKNPEYRRKRNAELRNWRHKKGIHKKYYSKSGNLFIPNGGSESNV